MKKHHTLECDYDYDFVVLGINSHIKAYKICWHLNKKIGLNLEMTEDHKTENNLFFSRYTFEKSNGISYDLISNRSKKGYMISSHKNLDYFLILRGVNNWKSIKQELLNEIKKINDILLAFEVDVDKIKNKDRFIIHDKKN